MYKIETHLHTCYSSSCGKLDAETIVKGYAEAGYAGLVVVDHFSAYNFGKQGWSRNRAEFSPDSFWEGFYQVREAAKEFGITVYKGAEVRFDGSPNDYLVYNCPDAIYEDPDAVFSMGLAAFHALCARNGALLIQAHPFRLPCEPADPRHLDGVEIYNRHPRHDSQNHLAVAFAQENPHLLQLCGSDCHQTPDIALGGIITPTLPKDEAELVKYLRDGNFTLL